MMREWGTVELPRLIHIVVAAVAAYLPFLTRARAFWSLSLVALV